MNVLEASMALGGVGGLARMMQAVSVVDGPTGLQRLAAVARGYRPRVRHYRVSADRSVGLYSRNRRDFSKAKHTKMKAKWAKLNLPAA